MEQKINKELKVAVIGVGNIGSAHAATLYHGQIEGARLCALCDIDPAKQATLAGRYPDIPIYGDAEALFAAGIADAVIVSVPHRLHAPIGVSAFAAGLHVLCEKPIGVSVSDADALERAAAQSGKVFAVMWNQRTDPLFRRAKELVQSGALGERKRIVWTVTNWYRSQAYYNSGGWRATWSGEGGGVLLNQAPHNLDLLQWIFGMPARVRGFCAEGKFHHIEVEDDATLYFEYDNGATGVFITSTGEYPGTNRLEITGDLGKLVLEDGKLRLWQLSQHEREFCFTTDSGFPSMPVSYTEEQPEPFGWGGHGAILQNFVNAILHGEELISPGAEGRNELSLSNAAYLSSWTGQTVELPIDGTRFDALLSERAKHSTFRPAKEETLHDGYHPRWQVRW